MSTINITDSYISSIFDNADSVAPNDIMENASSMATNDLIESYIPSYTAEDAWQPWDVDEVCPAGFTCASMGDSSLGAFSCDEMARVANETFGFGNVLAGTWCPEGKEGVYNCPVGSYCPDTKTRIECPEGKFCPYKTLEPTFAGGAVGCNRCPVGAEEKQLTHSEVKAVQTVLVILFILLIIGFVAKRKVSTDNERLKKKFSMHRESSEIQSIKRDKEKYKRLQPRLEMISQRLGKIQGKEEPQDVMSPRSISLSERKTVLYIDDKGDIIFDAAQFFNIIDQNDDGVLSFEEINQVLCLEEEKLNAFIASMRMRMTRQPEVKDPDKVARSTFVMCFIDALADASQFGSHETPNYGISDEPTPSEEAVRRMEGESEEPLRPCVVWVEGLDVAFQDLTLTVSMGKKEKVVVNKVSGRLRSNTMTAVMGGSGSGKSSLLNALCGRAYYGKTTGKVSVNGNDSKIENHKSCIGFVPQEDIVFADLTVKENLLYAGRLYLPKGTSEKEINELADATLAALGLSRIANSLVGDATRRGVSGGEKKRVNIGVELMKQPQILFLDEPTSGLDSRSAFVVMESLYRLCQQGMTVASVIHQPRTDIYAMFDSLFLLGVGGSTVYHGPAMEAREYFEGLGFKLKPGDSQADWFLDISSGDVNVDAAPGDEEMGNEGIDATILEQEKLIHSNDGSGMKRAEQNREQLYQQWSKYIHSIPQSKMEQYYLAPSPYDLPTPVESVTVWRQLAVQIRRNCLLSWRNLTSKFLDFSIVVVAIFAITILAGANPNSYLSNPSQLLWIKFIASEEDASQLLFLIFGYAYKGLNAISNYTMMVGLILSVLVGLSATKVITNNRLEFFRECQSGANVTAFYIAASTTATVEQGFSAICGALVAYLISMPASSFDVYLWNFFAVSWLSVSWALLLAIVVPLGSVSTVVGFFNAFFGLLFCGKVTPGLYTSIYSNPALAVFSGFLSPLRFFVEGICVSEAKCFPNQSGYTVSPGAFNFPLFNESYPYWYELTYMAHTDINEAIVHDCTGWFWWVPAVFAVGFTIRLAGCIAINFSDRDKQGKKSLKAQLTDGSNLGLFLLKSCIVLIIFAGLFVLSSWLILRSPKESST